jgi:hypothetical protein
VLRENAVSLYYISSDAPLRSDAAPEKASLADDGKREPVSVYCVIRMATGGLFQSAHTTQIECNKLSLIPFQPAVFPNAPFTICFSPLHFQAAE